MKTRYFVIFTLCLSIWTACNNKNEPEQEIPRLPLTAKFSYTINDLTVTFKNQSLSATTYLWQFGDNSSSQEQNPTYTYAAEGTYTVKLFAYDGDKNASYTQDITVTYSTPSAKFEYKTEAPLKVVLTNKSVGAKSYLWDFGDGTTSTEANPTHRYSGIGVYKVKLTAKNGTKNHIYQTNVTIEAPTKCYLSGFQINKIPYNNQYYQIQLTDDYSVIKDTYAWITWRLLSSANIPSDINFTNPVLLDVTKKYVVRLYKSSTKQTGQDSGKGFWTYSFSSSTLSTYPEVISYSDATASVKTILTWK